MTVKLSHNSCYSVWRGSRKNNVHYHSALRYFTISTFVALYAKNKLNTRVRLRLHTANISTEPVEADTVEGNSGDSCRVNQYSVGHYEILGYGVPNY